MPQREIKQIYAELDAGKFWPVYWVYGAERMKSREVLKRISQSLSKSFEGSVNRESLDGAETHADRVVEASQSLSLLARAQLIVVRDAHLLKEAESLRGLWETSTTSNGAVAAADLGSVCVLMAKDLDGRKKISKELLKHAAVIECAEVPETEREAWIRFLVKNRATSAAGLPAIGELDEGQMAQLMGMEPWSLDAVDQELEKLSLLRFGAGAGDAASVFLQEGLASRKASARFLDAYLAGDRKTALSVLPAFVSESDEVFPLLGLLAWNLRQVAQIRQGSMPKLGPWLLDRLRRVANAWDLEGLKQAQSELLEMDLALKQKPLEPVGVWSGFVLRTLQSP